MIVARLGSNAGVTGTVNVSFLVWPGHELAPVQARFAARLRSEGTTYIWRQTSAGFRGGWNIWRQSHLFPHKVSGPRSHNRLHHASGRQNVGVHVHFVRRPDAPAGQTFKYRAARWGPDLIDAVDFY